MGSSVWALGASTDDYHHIVMQHTLSGSSLEPGSLAWNAAVSKTDRVPDLWILQSGVDADPTQDLGTKAMSM